MARLFIFAIGGTGSRVLRSLTMLLAAGVKPQTSDTFEIVPIIIDPHKSNDDLKRTMKLMSDYQAITDEVGIANGFFGTSLKTLDQIGENRNRVKGNFSFNLQQVSNQRFSDYIDFNQLNVPNKSLIDLLFSGKSINKRGEQVDLLDIEMDIGFVGNPNVGSIVLNQFKDSDEFREFATNFNSNDRIFIISSIFGGTGAAGFPTILKNIRDARNIDNIISKGDLENAKVGAVTVLPYFNLQSDQNSPISKSDFIAKTKSALYYYEHNVNKYVNALYYIADDHSGLAYENDPGEHGQRNKAHFVELAAALSIIDFLEMPDSDLITSEGIALKTHYREFGIKNNVPIVDFLTLGAKTQETISLKLSQLHFLTKYVEEQLDKSIDKQPWSTDNRPDSPPINSAFLSTSFYKNYVREFLSSYKEWLDELGTNNRSFMPFELDAAISSTIYNVKAEDGFFKKEVTYSYFDSELSSVSRQKGEFHSSAQKFIKMFSMGTGNILKNKFPYFKNMSR